MSVNEVIDEGMPGSDAQDTTPDQSNDVLHGEQAVDDQVGGVGGSHFDLSKEPETRPIEVLQGVEMSVTVELGRTRMLVRELLGLRVGSVVELDRQVGANVDILVNGTLLAKGEVVVVDDELGVRITDIAHREMVSEI